MSKNNTYAEPKWVTDKPVPAVNTLVNVKINGIGRSKVLRYFTEHGFLGLVVKPLSPPDWYAKQNGADAECHVFPAECEELRVLHDDGKPNEEFYAEQLKA